MANLLGTPRNYFGCGTRNIFSVVRRLQITIGIYFFDTTNANSSPGNETAM